jgi:hypothetical protein
MMTNSFENKKFHAVNEKALNGFSFFFCLAEGRGRLFLFFSLVLQCVLILFPWGSPSSEVVPKTFPIAPRLYPIWFAQSPTLMYTIF